MVNASSILWYVGGMIALLFVLQVLAKPLTFMLRLGGNAIVGGMALWGLNFIGTSVHYHIGLNPLSALTVGLLGIPGLVGLGILRLLLG